MTGRRLEALVCLALILVGGGAAAAADPAPRMAGRLLLRERAGLSSDALRAALQRLGVQRLAAVGALGATVIESDEATLVGLEAALRRSGMFKSVERDYLAHVAEVPDDPFYGTQWGLPRVGAPAAWGLSSGAGVTVAVVDTGVDLTHPDLQGRLLPGYDFINDDALPSDDNGHGTRMSGVIAATRDNGLGVSGVAPEAMLLPIKALDGQGQGPYSAVASGIVYAVDQGARVINLSLAGAAPSGLLQDAVDYALAHDRVVVAAAGNFGSDLVVYPAATPGVVAVGAIASSDTRWSYSNYGAWVSVAAPGVEVATTSLAGSYSTSTGTSPAAAFGSGVFALLLGGQPALTRQQAVQRVQDGAVDLGPDGWDPYYGAGRVDAYAALVPGGSGAPPPDRADPTVAILSPAKGSLLSGMVPVDVAAGDDVGIARVELFLDNRWHATATAAPYAFVIDAASLSPGQHKLRAYAYDLSGNVTRTRSLAVTFTPGAGLLVTHAVARERSIGISSQFSLPPGLSFDPKVDAVTVSLTSANGTVLSFTAAPGALATSPAGKMQGTVAPSIPAIGSVRLTSKSSGAQPVYSLKIKAANLSGMSALDPQMSLAVQVGAAQLSQSLPCRSKGTTLLYP